MFLLTRAMLQRNHLSSPHHGPCLPETPNIWDPSIIDLNVTSLLKYQSPATCRKIRWDKHRGPYTICWYSRGWAPRCRALLLSSYTEVILSCWNWGAEVHQGWRFHCSSDRERRSTKFRWAEYRRRYGASSQGPTVQWTESNITQRNDNTPKISFVLR